MVSAIVISFLLLFLPSASAATMASATDEKTVYKGDGSLAIEAKVIRNIYTPQCFIECHLGLEFKYNGSSDPTTKTFNPFSITSSFTKQFGNDEMQITAIKIQLNQTYDDGIYSDKETCLTQIEINGTIWDKCTTEKIWTSDPKWRYVWDDVGSVHLENGMWYKIDIIAKRKAIIGKAGSDIVPNIYGLSFPEFAWFNTSYGSKISISKDLNQVNESVEVKMMGVSGFNRNMVRSDCADIQVTDASETLQIPFQLTNCTTTDVNVLILSPAGTGIVAFIYFNNSLDTIFDNVPMRIWNDTFDTNTTGNYFFIQDGGAVTPNVQWNSSGFVTMTTKISPSFNTIFGRFTNDVSDKMVYAWMNFSTSENLGKGLSSSCNSNLNAPAGNSCWIGGLDRSAGNRSVIYSTGFGENATPFAFGGFIWHKFKMLEQGNRSALKIWNITTNEQNGVFGGGAWNVTLTSNTKSAFMNISGIGVMGQSASTGTVQFDNLEIWYGNSSPLFYANSSQLSFLLELLPPTIFTPNTTITYLCSGSQSWENTTIGNSTSVVALGCNFGCSNDNPVNFVAQRSPQGDLCNEQPIVRDLKLIAGIIGIFLFAILLKWILRKLR